MTSSQSAIARVETKLDHFANDPQWQRIWLAIQAEKWRSLAVIPADATLPTIEVVHALAAVACQQRGSPLVVADLRSVDLPILDAVRAEVEARTAAAPILMAVPAFDESPVALAIARAADKAVLCVGLGTTLASQARKTIQQLGHDRFLGTVTLRLKRTGARPSAWGRRGQGTRESGRNPGTDRPHPL